MSRSAGVHADSESKVDLASPLPAASRLLTELYKRVLSSGLGSGFLYQAQSVHVTPREPLVLPHFQTPET